MKKPNASLHLTLTLTALLLALPAVVRAQFTFKTNNGAITITRYFGPGGDVTIPDWTNGYPVTSLGTSLGGSPFSSCTSLTSIRVGTNVTSICVPVSRGCWRLTAITVNTNNPVYSSVAGILFNKRQTTLVECPEGYYGSYTIPNSVTNIGSAAFGGCGLTNVTIPNSVISIGVSAFEGCPILGSVTIPDSVTSIGQWAFRGCDSLTNLTIGAGVTSIGSKMVYYSFRLTAITVDTNNPAYSSVAGVLFNKSQTTLVACPDGKTGSYAIPNGVTSIGEEAFLCCNGLDSITMPDTVTSIGDGAFEYCTAVTTMTIPNRVTTIGNWVFEDCRGLTNVTIPNSITRIGRFAFGNCSRLTSVTIPDSVTSIWDGAFEFCSSLTSFTIPNSVTDLAGNTFCGCRSLTSVTLPNSIASIGDELFYWCNSLTNVTIPDSVTSIGQWAFRECPSLASVTIGTNVTSIGDYGFYGCPSLTGVYFQGNAPSLGSAVFDGDNNATVYYLPGTTGWGATFGGLPTALWTPPIIQTAPQTQTAEAGSAVGLRVHASSSLPLFYLWYLNDTNLISCSTNCALELTNVQFSQAGTFTVVITNAAGAVTSSPAILNVIAAVERRPVPGVKLTGQTGSVLNVDCTSSLSPAPDWTTLGSVSLTSTSQYYFDLALPQPPQQFYRAWQTGATVEVSPLDLHMVPAITLTGNFGDAWRVDCINRFGPTNAWVTLDTVTLTNRSQLYFDVSAPGQPQRLYRLVQVP